LAYAGSKAAAVSIGKSLATFLAPWGIRSNIIAPGSK
jgi:NAD(P)-dependent dehydrogenase (short-subunit alcohol dehydrogenase family)